MTRDDKSGESGVSLLITLFVVLLVAVFIAIAMNLTSQTLRRTDSRRDFSALEASAEGALDFAYGVWAKTINSYYRPVSESQLAAPLATVPSFSDFSYASGAENGPLKIYAIDQYGEPVASISATPVPSRVTLDNYPGWIGYNSSYIASVRLTGTFIGGRTVKYGAKRRMNYSDVPLFQATAFFEDDLELFKTAKMTIGGLVHTNSKAYVSSPEAGTLTFTGNLSYVTGYTDSEPPPRADTWSGYTPHSTLPPTFPDGFGDLGKDPEWNHPEQRSDESDNERALSADDLRSARG